MGPGTATDITLGDCRMDVTLEPVSGIAVPVYKGEVLRMAQIDGGQCVDFNCFNLHDYKEHMSIGHMRRDGFRARQGQFVWSNPPRFHPMMKIIHVPSACSIDMLAARCNGVLFEHAYGFADHPNCQDTLAESIGAFGLTPDDVHDPLNIWMNTEWDHVGWYSQWNTAAPDDEVDLLATMDVLAVSAICGAGDVSVTGNFGYGQVRVRVFAASEVSSEMAGRAWLDNTTLSNQRTLDQFRVREIRTNPELARDPRYIPHFKMWPMTNRSISVAFSDDEYRRMWSFRGILGNTDEELVRVLFIEWNRKHRMRGGGD